MDRCLFYDETLPDLLNKRCFHPFDACLLGLFLDIPLNELISSSERQQTVQDPFNSMIIEMFIDDLTFMKIARRLDTTYDYIYYLCTQNDLDLLYRDRFDRAACRLNCD